MRLSGQVSTLTRQQKYFRTRENRNFSTVHSTEGRIFNLNLMETGLMIAMAALQVFVVKMFFTGGRKGMFICCGLLLLSNANLGLNRLRLKRVHGEAVLNIVMTEKNKMYYGLLYSIQKSIQRFLYRSTQVIY